MISSIFPHFFPRFFERLRYHSPPLVGRFLKKNLWRGPPPGPAGAGLPGPGRDPLRQRLPLRRGAVHRGGGPPRPFPWRWHWQAGCALDKCKRISLNLPTLRLLSPWPICHTRTQFTMEHGDGHNFRPRLYISFQLFPLCILCPFFSIPDGDD